jgi:hypothetical protein
MSLRTGRPIQAKWKAGKRHGQGKAMFALGGSHEGQWAEDRFHSQGKVTYAGSGRVASGEFRDGYLAGAAPSQAGLPSERFAIREAQSVGSMLSCDRITTSVPPGARDAERDLPDLPALHGLSRRTDLVHADRQGWRAQERHHDRRAAPGTGRLVDTVTMMQRFKPGICDGNPCELIYPIKCKFTTTY